MRGGLAAALVLGFSAVGVAAQDAALRDTLSLDRALTIALERSPDVRSAAAAADAAGAGLNLGRSDFTKTTFVSDQGTSEMLPEPLSSTSQSAARSSSTRSGRRPTTSR